MKIRLASDLHLDHYTSYTQAKIINAITSRETPYDVLCLAGDISEGPKVVGFLRQICEAATYPTPVMFVLGNHDCTGVGEDQFYYMGDAHTDIDNLHWLSAGHALKLSSPRGIVGTSMWYEYTAHTAQSARDRNWYDWHAIPHFEAFWRHHSTEELLGFNSDTVDDGSTILTHFLPSYDLVDPKYACDPTNVFYVAPHLGEDIIIHKKPKLWMFGHTHTWTDKMVHETRCVSRPFGYPRESEKLDYRNWHRDCTFEVTT